MATVETMRISWEKQTNPYLRFLSNLHRPHLKIKRQILIPRPKRPSQTAFVNKGDELPPVKAWLMFDGTEEELNAKDSVILQFPGGGFVTMNPLHHDDYTGQWSKRLSIPIVSIDYGKAPEHPYPWAVEECFDAYRSIVESNGAVIGIHSQNAAMGSNEHQPHRKLKIVFVGDSA